MSPYVRQTNFSGGELSPYLWGRTDLPRFQTGLRTLRNMFVTPHGAAMSRPGTTFVALSGAGDGTLATSRLIPFVYSDSQSFVLEFVAGTIGLVYFYLNGAQLLAPYKGLVFKTQTVNFTVGQVITGATSGATGTLVLQSDGGAAGTVYLNPIAGVFLNNEVITDPLGGHALANGTQFDVPYTVVVPYTVSTDLGQLQYAQSGDVLTLTHPSYPPAELTRISNTNWTFTNISFDRPATTVTNPSIQLPLPVVDATHPAKEWSWEITEIRRDARGVVYESVPTLVPKDSAGVALPVTIACFFDRPVQVNLNSNYGSLATDPNFLAYRIYRGRADRFGWVGDSKSATFTDIGTAPDYTITPPEGRNPFKIYDAAGALTRTEYPAAVTFFQERRVFGGTANRPGFLFASATGDYANFDSHIVPLADDPCIFELAARKREDIRDLVGVRKLLAITNASSWAVDGSGSPLEPSSVEAIVQDEVGATRVPHPLVVNGSVLFSRAKGTGVRGLTFDFKHDSYLANDLSIAASHLFTGIIPASSYIPLSQQAITDWTYAEDPFSIVWAVRSDGALLSLTYSETEGIAAWAKHDTQGSVLSVCSVPEGSEDVVYMSVVRTVTVGGVAGRRICIERMTSRVVRGTTADDICLDCALQYSGSPTTVITGLSMFEGLTVYATGLGNPVFGPLTVTGGQITLPDLPVANVGGHTVVLYVGLLFTPELETLDISSADARLRQKTVVSVGLEVTDSRGLVAGQDLDHLVEWTQRDVAAGYGAISNATALILVPILGTWETSARAALRQTLPLPLTVVGITRELDVGGP